MKNIISLFQRLFYTLLSPGKSVHFLEPVTTNAVATEAALAPAAKAQLHSLLHKAGTTSAPMRLVLGTANKEQRLQQAQWLAQQMKQPLYRVHLAAVISKYIGETEKNLSLVFSKARQSGAALFFDEADALFGKRSEVKDAHDRYANQEVAYLMQQLQSYPHPVFVYCKNGDSLHAFAGFDKAGY